MEKIKFSSLPFEFEYAGRVFLIQKSARLFTVSRSVNLIAGSSLNDSKREYICLVWENTSGYVLDCLISTSYKNIIDLYLDSLEKYA